LLLILWLARLVAEASAQTTGLELGKTNQGDLPEGQAHSYSIKLKANQYLRAVVTQTMSRLVVELYAPDGKKSLEIDTNFFKPCRIVWVAETAAPARSSRPLSRPGPGAHRPDS